VIGQLRPYTWRVNNSDTAADADDPSSAGSPGTPDEPSADGTAGAETPPDTDLEPTLGPVKESHLADTPEDEAQAEPEAEAPSLEDARRSDGATIALVAGQAVTELPKDLYIPPEALEVFLETFEGPLDLLLYLIRRQNLDILEVSVAEITEQYMGYIDLMTALQLELVGEYLVMAAMLAEIKSRMLLPRPASIIEDEEDPRAELIRRLQQYERFKTAAENIDELPRLERDIRVARAERPELVREKAEPDVDLRDMLLALGQVLRKADMFQKHAVQLEPLTVRERMSNLLAQLRETTEFTSFVELFDPHEGRQGVVVTFLAILELVREDMLDMVQNEPFAPIYVRPASGEAKATADDLPAGTGEIDDPFEMDMSGVSPSSDESVE